MLCQLEGPIVVDKGGGFDNILYIMNGTIKVPYKVTQDFLHREEAPQSCTVGDKLSFQRRKTHLIDQLRDKDNGTARKSDNVSRTRLGSDWILGIFS